MENRKVGPQSKDYVFGTRAVIETIESGKEIERVLIQKDVRNELSSELVGLLAKRKIPYSKVPVDKLNRITQKNHQGAIAFISPIIYQSLDHTLTSAFEAGKNPLVLILDRVTDVRNFGAIARTAECAGADAIVIPAKGGAQINSDAVKTSAGALNHVPVCRENNLKLTIKFLQESGLTVVACTEKTERSVYESDLSGPVALLFGSEEDGISNAYMDQVDEFIAVPMFGKVASLNVGVSVAVVAYEAIRQRNAT